MSGVLFPFLLSMYFYIVECCLDYCSFMSSHAINSPNQTSLSDFFSIILNLLHLHINFRMTEIYMC